TSTRTPLRPILGIPAFLLHELSCQSRPMNGKVNRANKSLSRVNNIHLASEFLCKTALDQARSKSLMSRRSERRSATLLPPQGNHWGSLPRRTHETFARPESLEKAPYLLALVAKSCNAMASAKAPFGGTQTAGPSTRSLLRPQSVVVPFSPRHRRPRVGPFGAPTSQEECLRYR